MSKSKRVRSRRGKGTKRRRGGQFDAAMMAVPAMFAKPVYNLGKSSASSAYNGAKGLTSSAYNGAKGLASSAYGTASLASQKAREKASGMYSSMFGKSSSPQPPTLDQPGMGGRRTRRRRRH